jgi:hypothetical protein
MISQFPSCAGDSAIPGLGTFAPESRTAMPSANDGDDFRLAITRALNPAGTGLPSSQSLPANSPRSRSYQTDQAMSSSRAPLATNNQAPPEAGGQIQAAPAAPVRPKSAKAPSAPSVDASSPKVGDGNQAGIDPTLLAGAVGLLAQPAAGGTTPALPGAASTGTNEAAVLTGQVGCAPSDPTGTKEAAVLTGAAKKSEVTTGETLKTDPKADLQLPLAQDGEKTAAPRGAREPAGDASRPSAAAAHGAPAETPLSTQTTPDPGDATTSALPKPDQNQGGAIVPGLQPLDIQNATIQMAAQNSEVAADGTGAALNDPRMKFAGQTNESAGQAVQKLPRGPGNRDGQAVLDAVSGIRPRSKGLSGKEEAAVLSGSFDLRTETTAGNLQWDGSTLTEPSATAGQPATRVEQVAHLVAQEAAMVRQSGSTSLAVSLKLDPHTELFVQLTNHDGQLQASLRCERGSLAGLDGHWGQLQDSLARQNVQLLPLQDRNFSRSSSTGPNANGGESRHFGQSSQDQPSAARDGRTDVLREKTVGGPARSRKSDNRTTRRQGWESWA